ncbi:MAG: AtpZ/AtpI family protein [Thermodesulfobacteriota bacterium]
MKEDLKRLFRLIGDVSTIGIAIAASVFIGFFIGYALDEYLFGGRTKPWLTVIFLIFGVIAGFRNLVRLARRKDL